MSLPVEGGWSRMGLRSWSDLAEIRARLAAGADPKCARTGPGTTVACGG